MTFDGQQYKIKELSSVSEVFQLWDFFLEGLAELNKLPRKQDQVSEDTLLKTLLHATEVSKNGDGLVLVVYSSSGKPLFWGVALNNTPLFKARTCVVYAVYSNKKAKGVVSTALDYLESWARRNRYTQLQGFSPCFNGSRFRLFENVWGFHRAAILFTRDL